MKEQRQATLFDMPEWWEEHWQDMPEFQQDDQTAYKQVIVNFQTLEDMEQFAALLGQRLTLHTKSIWYPEVKPADLLRFQYQEES